jgi:hypothetical protein
MNSIEELSIIEPEMFCHLFYFADTTDLTLTFALNTRTDCIIQE